MFKEKWFDQKPDLVEFVGSWDRICGRAGVRICWSEYDWGWQVRASAGPEGARKMNILYEGIDLQSNQKP